MKKLSIFFMAALLFFAFAFTAQAWNLGAMHVNALLFEKNGSIKFTLFRSGLNGEEFLCQGTNPWFKISPCSASDAVCNAAVNRMGSMLLGAKLSGKAVHVQNANCEVSEVALQP